MYKKKTEKEKSFGEDEIINLKTVSRAEKFLARKSQTKRNKVTEKSQERSSLPFSGKINRRDVRIVNEVHK